MPENGASARWTKSHITGIPPVDPLEKPAESAYRGIMVALMPIRLGKHPPRDKPLSIAQQPHGRCEQVT